MYFLIQNAPIRWPDKARHGIDVSPEAQDLITNMLEKDRSHRLGHQKDVEDILSHPWFKSLDISALLKKQIKAPFIPKVVAEADLQNFEKEVTESSLADSLVPQEKVK
jgi:hypothetical protein